MDRAAPPTALPSWTLPGSLLELSPLTCLTLALPCHLLLSFLLLQGLLWTPLLEVTAGTRIFEALSK